jgi:DNA-binding transcriptional regulator LsrR (DeoR family)
VGLAGGELIASMIDAAPSITVSDVRVVQGLGWENAPARHRSLPGLVSELAHRIEASPMTLPAPSIVSSEAVRHSFEADPHIDDALRALGSLDSLYVEIRSDVAEATSLAGAPAETAVGSLALRHFDCTGRFLGTAVDGHVLGITVEQMRQAAHVVALAHGPRSAHVFAAALRTGLVGTLITDELTACAIDALRPMRCEPVVSNRANDARSIR